MKIYISGAYGMVGRNILQNLEEDGFEILKTRSSELNLLHYDEIKNYLNENKPDFVIHCAGKVGGIQANIKDSYGFFTENMLMGINLVKAAKEAEIKNLLNLSSSCSYPPKCENPLKEEYVFDGKLEPTNEGYAIAKASITKMCEFVTRQFNGYNYKTIIPCNLYGRYDKFGENNSHMIPAVIKKLHLAKENNINVVEIWGSGNARREFMYAGDLAQMVNYIVKNFEKMPPVLNVGLGYDYTVNEYYEIIAKIVGFNGTFVHDTAKPEGMKQKLLDITKQKEFGLKSIYSIEEGIKETYKYYLEEENNAL
jgi:GDP-L-fucose synthase